MTAESKGNNGRFREPSGAYPHTPSLSTLAQPSRGIPPSTLNSNHQSYPTHDPTHPLTEIQRCVSFAKGCALKEPADHNCYRFTYR